jgi:hypothetical protein
LTYSFLILGYFSVGYAQSPRSREEVSAVHLPGADVRTRSTDWGSWSEDGTEDEGSQHSLRNQGRTRSFLEWGCLGKSLTVSISVERNSTFTEQIIIGTPGKMIEWMVRQRLIDASKIICFVLDEADIMISQEGHQDNSIQIHKLVYFSSKFDTNKQVQLCLARSSPKVQSVNACCSVRPIPIRYSNSQRG